MELERRVHAMLEENEVLKNTVEDLRDRTLVLETQCHEKDLQVQNLRLCVYTLGPTKGRKNCSHLCWLYFFV